MRRLSQQIADQSLTVNKIKAEIKQLNQVKKEAQDALDQLVIKYDFEGDVDLDEEDTAISKFEQSQIFS